MNTFAQTRTSCRSLGSVQFPGTKFRYYSHSSKKSSLGNGYPWTSLGPGISHTVKHSSGYRRPIGWGCPKHVFSADMSSLCHHLQLDTTHATGCHSCIAMQLTTQFTKQCTVQGWNSKFGSNKERKKDSRQGKKTPSKDLTKARKPLSRQNSTKKCVYSRKII